MGQAGELQRRYLGIVFFRPRAKFLVYYCSVGPNLLGSLQVDGGVPGAAVGKPVLTQYSPAGYEQAGVWQCVHAST